MLPLYKMRQTVSDLQPLCIGRKRLCTPLHSTYVQKLCCQAVQWVVPLQALGMCVPACDAPILHRRTLNRCGSPPGQQTSTPTRACLVRSSPGSAVFCRQPVHSVQLQHCSRLPSRRTHQMQTLQQRMQPCRRYAHSGSQSKHVLCKQPTVAAMASLHNIYSFMVA